MRNAEILVLLLGMGFCIWIAGLWASIADFLQERKIKATRQLKRHVIKSQITPKPWGHEELWGNTRSYAAKFLHINAGHRLSKQYHKKKIETIIILKGKMKLHLEWRGDKTAITMLVGDIYHIHEHLVHRMEAVTDVIVAEVSTPHLEDIVRLEDDYGR